MKHTTYLLFLSLIILASCKSKKAVVAPAVNNRTAIELQIDSFLNVARQQQPSVLTDSAGAAVPSQFVNTVNFNLRKPNFVIIHFTAQDSVQQTINTFSMVRTQVSAHYVIAKNGTVVHMLNDYLRSWHAGVSKWGSVTDMNSCSIGIEVDNNGNEPFNDVQVNSLLALLAQLKKTYNIPTANFIGHQDIAPGRKPDPGPFFPWQKLADHGFGYWSDYIVVPAPANYDYATALRLIGYDTRDLNAAVVAFKRHFIQTDISPQITQLDLNVLYNLTRKY